MYDKLLSALKLLIYDGLIIVSFTSWLSLRMELNFGVLAPRSENGCYLSPGFKADIDIAPRTKIEVV